MNPERSYVLNVGSIEITHGPFTERGFKLLRVKLAEVRKAANGARAIIIAEPPGRIGLIRSRLRRLKPAADAYGLAFGLLVSADELDIVQNVVSEVGVGKRSSVRPITEVGHIAEFIRRDPGPPVGDDVEVFQQSRIRAHVKYLLKRSFHDCDQIYLESLSGGRASLNVFSVHAWLRKSVVGPRPMPF
ncbi:MAG: hypothetical protein ACREIW_05280, partial [Chthoniobacterales bacterium]